MPKAAKTVHKSLAANRRARRKRRAQASPAPRKNPSANPPMVSDLTHVLLPGFAAYGATRIFSRIVYNFVQPRWPSLGKHMHALAGALSFGGTWFFAHKIEKLAPYHDGIVMGSGIAALQGVATAYLPEKYNWLLSDVSPDDVTPAATPPAPDAQPAQAGDEYSYLEDQVERRGKKKRRNRQLQSTSNENPGSPPTQSDQNDDLMSILNDGETPEDLYSGSFAN